MRDIETRADLEFLLAEFYKIATVDEEIGHHFDGLDLTTHLPVIVDFWEKVLFGKPVYFGNPLIIHQKLNEKSPPLFCRNSFRPFGWEWFARLRWKRN